SRNSYAFFVDLEADVTDNWLMNVAVRYENFSDFGDTLNWKVATRYEVLDGFAFRGSVGTGFRAPTPGQISTTNISTRIAPDGNPVAEGIFPASNPVSAFFGATELTPEESFQYTAGITLDLFDGLNVTVDYYNIELTDRIALSSDFEVGMDAQMALGDLVTGIAQVSFFTNGIDTTTRGIDIVATYAFETSLGDTSLTGSMNYNQTDFDRVGSVGGNLLFNDETQADNAEGIPNLRAVVTAQQGIGDFNLLTRINYFGTYQQFDGNNAPLTRQDFSPEVMVDLELSYRYQDQFTLAFGGQNIFDNFPDPAEFEECCGRIYDSGSVVPWQGGFWYVRLQADF
ncbi:MAG: TonB-dependent receptor, partial [Pseudomonadota bacterium]